MFFANRVSGVYDPPVILMPSLAGRRGLDSRFVAQLHAGPPGQPLIPVGDPVPFLDDLPSPLGYFTGVTRTIPNVAPGGPAHVQVTAWYRGLGSTYAEAATRGLGGFSVRRHLAGRVA